MPYRTPFNAPLHSYACPYTKLFGGSPCRACLHVSSLLNELLGMYLERPFVTSPCRTACFDFALSNSLFRLRLVEQPVSTSPCRTACFDFALLNSLFRFALLNSLFRFALLNSLFRFALLNRLFRFALLNSLFRLRLVDRTLALLQLGAYHTLELDLQRAFTIIKVTFLNPVGLVLSCQPDQGNSPQSLAFAPNEQKWHQLYDVSET
jgi:hypothetical protein